MFPEVGRINPTFTPASVAKMALLYAVAPRIWVAEPPARNPAEIFPLPTGGVVALTVEKMQTAPAGTVAP